MDLPCSTGDIFELAIARLPWQVRQRLQDKGWSFADPSEPSLDPASYQQFLQASKAAFSVAKAGYVVSRSGWLSAPPACDPAPGRPEALPQTPSRARVAP